MRNLRLEDLGEGIVSCVFDREGSSANVFDEATLLELGDLVEELSASRPRGLLFETAKQGVFIAGADVRELLALRGPEELRAKVEAGQRLFNRIAALPFPTVAAIHGACLGGGLEMALACSVRIASDGEQTRIGLPETSLGILPAWGGSTRLVRLLGLPAALDLILRGRMLKAKQAFRKGLVDDLMPREILRKVARKRILTGTPDRSSHLLVNNPVAARLAARQAKESVEEKTRGLYPAPLRAVDVCAAAATGSLEASLRRERDAVVELARTPEARALLRLFLVREKARHEDLGTAGHDRRIRRAAVVGAGVMGAGIAQWLAARKTRVLLQDVNESAVLKGLQRVDSLFRAALSHHSLDAHEVARAKDRITPVAVPVPLSRVDLVLEAAPEKMEIKHAIFRAAEERAGSETILATNTSSLSVTEIAAGLARPERVAGLHFFNPVHRMELVEVVRGEKTAPEVADALVRFVQDLGKLPVVVRDRPGFLVNRVLMPYLTEAGRLCEEGASVAEIDGAMEEFGMPMGPLRLLDEVGLDVALDVAGHLSRALPERMVVPEIFSKLVAAGCLGRKSGAGFYVHGEETRVNEEAVRAAGGGGGGSGRSPEEMRESMVFLMVNEAARALEEEVVSSAEEVDLAMVIGTGFAPFRGGPLRHADAVGLSAIVVALERRAEKDARFSPAPLLVSTARGAGRFHAV